MTGERLRLMAVHAHPDDESSKGAATTARYAAEGVDVLVVTCTGGERGDVLNPQLPGPSRAASTAMREVPPRTRWPPRRAALGVRQHWLGFVDSGLPEGDPLPPLPEGCFALRPARGGRRRRWSSSSASSARTSSPRTTRRAATRTPTTSCATGSSVEAFDAAGDPERYRGRGRAVDAAQALLQPRLLAARGCARCTRRSSRAGRESPFGDWVESPPGARDPRARGDDARRVRRRTSPPRDDALRAHATQIDPDGLLLRDPARARGRACGRTEEYELAALARAGHAARGRPVRRAARRRLMRAGPGRAGVARRAGAEPVAVGRADRRHAAGGVAGVPRLRRSRSRSRSPCVFLFLSLTKQLRIVDRRARALGLDDDEPAVGGRGRPGDRRRRCGRAATSRSTRRGRPRRADARRHVAMSTAPSRRQRPSVRVTRRPAAGQRRPRGQPARRSRTRSGPPRAPARTCWCCRSTRRASTRAASAPSTPSRSTGRS